MVDKKEKQLEKIMAELNSKYGGNVVQIGAKEEIERISTGLVSIDKLTGGGIPRGRFSMIYGPKGAGKTTLCYKIISLVQEAGGKVVYVDAEHSYDPNWARTLGVDIDSLIFVSPKTLEISETVVQKFAPAVDLIVVDSIVAVGSEQEIDRELEKDTMALIPRKLSQFFRVVTSIVGRSKAAILLVNQTRTDLGAYVPIDKYPGGHALAHSCSLILKLWRSSSKDWPKDKVKVSEDKSGKPKYKEEVIGIRIKARTEKSKVSATEGTDTCFDLLKAKPHFDEYSDLFLASEMSGLVIHTGAWYTVLETEEKYQGREAVVDALRKNTKLFNKLREEVLKI